MTITTDILKAIAPGGKKTNYKLLSSLSLWMNNWLPKFEIDTKGELCHFLSQTAHESDSFNTLEEYASGDAYDTRIDLGNTPQRDGDGKYYKGRGLIETTGKKNYRELTLESDDYFGHEIDFVNAPVLLLKPEFAVWSAGVFWHKRDLNIFANMPDDAKIWSKKLDRNLSPIEYITWRVNGGFNHLKERKIFYERAKSIIV